MMNFNLMENFYFPIFHVHKNSNLNHFNFISKEVNVRVLHIGMQGENALFRRDLQHQVNIMRHGHELGESWSAKDGMVDSVEVCHKEVHVLSTKVVGSGKLDWQGDLPQRLGCSTRYNAPEWRINRNEIILCDS